VFMRSLGAAAIVGLGAQIFLPLPNVGEGIYGIPPLTLFGMYCSFAVCVRALYLWWNRKRS
jgi:hypothetical protein